jgi:hypothetical protein
MCMLSYVVSIHVWASVSFLCPPLFRHLRFMFSYLLRGTAWVALHSWIYGDNEDVTRCFPNDFTTSPHAETLMLTHSIQDVLLLLLSTYCTFSLCIVTRLPVWRPQFDSRQGQRWYFFPSSPRPDRLWGPPYPQWVGGGSFPGLAAGA